MGTRRRISIPDRFAGGRGRRGGTLEIYPENDPVRAEMTPVQRELVSSVIDACSAAQFDALLSGDEVVPLQIAESVLPKLSPDAVGWAATLWCSFIAQKHLQDMEGIGPPHELGA